MRRIRPLHQPLRDHRSKIITIEMCAVAYAHRFTQRRGPHWKERLMCHSANQVVAATIRYKSRFPHVEQCITKPITMSMLLCQQALTLSIRRNTSKDLKIAVPALAGHVICKGANRRAELVPVVRGNGLSQPNGHGCTQQVQQLFLGQHLSIHI